jgi:uncharacterized protein (DUF58 family)
VKLNRWWFFLFGVFMVGVLSRVYLLSAFSVMLALISYLARWWQEHSLKQVNYRRILHYTRGFPGEHLQMEALVENRKFLPVPWLRVKDPVVAAIGPIEEERAKKSMPKSQVLLVSLYSLRWYERDRRLYDLLLRQRGVHRLGPARLEAGDPFGLFEQVVDSVGADYLTVFPEPISFSELKLPVGDPFGDRNARRRLYEDPNRPMGIRDYRPEDDFRRIHWPATARTGELQVKVYQPISAQVMVVCLNVSTFPNYWEGTDPTLLEHLVRVTAAVLQRGMQEGYQVGLVSNGSLAHADQPFRVLPGRSRGHLAHLLSVLASVTPFAVGWFDRFLMKEMSRLPYGATVVIITGLVTPALVEAVMRLKEHGRRITLLSFGKDPLPTLSGINGFHYPFYS